MNEFPNIEINDVVCPVCVSVFVEPVLLPCNHIFCLSCFNGFIKNNSLTCPVCRARFGSWLRHATKNNTLVYQNLWKVIQKKFSEHINGKSKQESFYFRPSENVIISQKGEIRKEYETQLKAYEKEIRAEQEKELAASAKLIVNLYRSEKFSNLTEAVNLSELEENFDGEYLNISPNTSTEFTDHHKKMLLAGPSQSSSYSYISPRASSSRTSIGSTSKSNESIPSSSSSRYSLIKSFAVQLNRGTKLLKETVQRAILSKITPTEPMTVRPTKYHVTPGKDTDSVNSLKLEMCHFKPIRSCPTTPKKSLISNDLETPIPRRLSLFPQNINYKINQSKVKIHTFNHQSAFTPLGLPLKEKSPEIFKTPASRNNTKRKKKSIEMVPDIEPLPKLRRTTSRLRNNQVQKEVMINPIPNTRATKTTLKTRSSSKQLSEKNSKKKSDSNLNEISVEDKLIEEIIIEQAKSEQIILQEKRDFEYAKKLQEEINKSNNNNVNSKQPINNNYSLRNKRQSVPNEKEKIEKKVRKTKCNNSITIPAVRRTTRRTVK